MNRKPSHNPVLVAIGIAAVMMASVILVATVAMMWLLA